MKQLLRKAVRSLGFDVVRYNPDQNGLPADVSDEDRAIISRVSSFTMTSVERQISLIGAVRHIVRRGIPGCIVECGVWRGGSSMACALTLIQEKDQSRDLYLFDTFEGMSPPTEMDRTADGTLAQSHLQHDTDRTSRTSYWCEASIEDVRANLQTTNYPAERVHLIKGRVEDTIPAHSPSMPIALLRLDTDWYESTRHELQHLFPMLQRGGILLIDDYGFWQGARKATDEYFAGLPNPSFLHRIDCTGRLLVKE